MVGYKIFSKIYENESGLQYKYDLTLEYAKIRHNFFATEI